MRAITFLCLVSAIINSGKEIVSAQQEGVYDPSINCDDLSWHYCADYNTTFPQTREWLEAWCTNRPGFIKCLRDYDVTCGPDLNEQTRIDRHENFIQEICSNDTTLHSDLFDNIICMTMVIKDETCLFNYKVSDILRRSQQGLLEQGFVNTSISLNVFYEGPCMAAVFSLVCRAERIKQSCSTSAKDAYVQIMKLDQYPSPVCNAEIFDDLPGVTDAIRESLEEAKIKMKE